MKTVITDDQLLNNDFDSMTDAQISAMLEGRALKTNTKQVRASMYSIDNYNAYFNTSIQKVDKKERQKIRKVRDRFTNNILLYKQQQKQTELKNEINSFKDFYTKVYINSDYSLNSLCANNSDATTKVNIQLMLAIVKKSLTTAKKVTPKKVAPKK